MFNQMLLDQLEKHQLYRRLIVLFMLFLIAYTTGKSFAYAHISLSGDGQLETAAVIAAIQVPVTMLMGFVSKLYWDKK